jgi:hypothetical protein
MSQPAVPNSARIYTDALLAGIAEIFFDVRPPLVLMKFSYKNLHERIKRKST